MAHIWLKSDFFHNLIGHFMHKTNSQHLFYGHLCQQDGKDPYRSSKVASLKKTEETLGYRRTMDGIFKLFDLNNDHTYYMNIFINFNVSVVHIHIVNTNFARIPPAISALCVSFFVKTCCAWHRLFIPYTKHSRSIWLLDGALNGYLSPAIHSVRNSIR